MILCPYIVRKASSGVIFSVIFASRASIICIDSGTCDTIRVSLALAIRFFDISINRYTPNTGDVAVVLCWWLVNTLDPGDTVVSEFVTYVAPSHYLKWW